MILTRSNWTNKKIYLAGMLTLAVLILTIIAAIVIMLGLSALWPIFFATIFILGPVNFFVFTVKKILQS